MAKKKKDVLIPPCQHCLAVFPIPVKWCAECEAHCGLDGFLLGKEHCDRCVDGLNDSYIKRKKGRDKRIAAALERQKDPKNWIDSDAPEKFKAWVDSPEYKSRFSA